MPTLMARFPTSDMITLLGSTPRYDLGESFGPHRHLHDLLDHDDIPLGYGSAAGDLRLRAAIATRHGVDPDDVVITAGSMHALFLLAFCQCEPGDEAVTTTPLFPLATTALQAVGAQVNAVRLDFNHRYQVNPDAIRAALSERTRLVSLASPQNPSGVAVPPETIRSIADAMQAICPHATLLIDETYREAVYGSAPVTPSAVGLDPRIVSVGSLSKSHGVPGLRIGWAVTRNPELRQQLVLGKFSTVISCSAVDEALALRALAQDQRSRHDHFAAGVALTETWARNNANFVEWVRPDAGAMCCVRLRPDRFGDAAVTRFYASLNQQDARVANGIWFGEEARVFRLGFGLLSTSDLEAALARVTIVLDKESRI
jgi:aspartate/methionine/tyrosine aminotransferase